MVAIPPGGGGARRSGATASTLPTAPERVPARHLGARPNARRSPVGENRAHADAERGGGDVNHAGRSDSRTRWVAFVSASPRWFAPPITTVRAEGPSAE